MSAATAAAGPKVARNFIVLTSAEMLGQAVAFVASAYLARVLGRDGFGLWVFATSVITYLGFVVDAGTETWGTRIISTQPQRLPETFKAVILLRAVIALATCLILALATLPMEADRRLALSCGALTLAANACQMPWALRGMERMVPVALGTLLQRTTLMLLALLLAHGPASAPYATLWQGVGDVAAALLWLAVLLPMLSRPALAAARPSVMGTLRQSWPFAGSRVLRGAMFTLNIALIPLFWSDATVGIYGVANRLSMPLLVLSGLFGMSVFPAIMRACHVGGASERAALDATVRVLAVVFLPIAFGAWALAEPIISLGFSDRYIGAVGPLRVLLFALLCMVLSDNLRRILHARGRQHRDLRIVTTAAVASVPLNLVGIMWQGAMGAAWAALATEVLLLGMVIATLPSTGQTVRLRTASRPLLAASLMAGAVLATPMLPLVVRIGLGGVVYVGTLLALGLRPLTEIRNIEAASFAAAADRPLADDGIPST